jgi:hypothetical protein
LRCCLCREWRVASVASRACRCVGSRAGSAVTLPVTLRYATSRYATLRYGPPWPPLPPLSPSVRDLSIYVRPPPLTRLHLWCARPSAKHRAAPRSTNHYQSGLWEAPGRESHLPAWRAARQLAQPHDLLERPTPPRGTFGLASRSGVERSLGRRLRYVWLLRVITLRYVTVPEPRLRVRTRRAAACLVGRSVGRYCRR